MALALTGRPIPNETPHQESRGQRMSDGTAATLQVRAYADPDLEASARQTVNSSSSSSSSIADVLFLALAVHCRRS